MKCSRHNSLLTYNYLLVLSCHQHQSGSFWLRYAPNRLSAWASPQTPLGSLQCSSRPLAGLGGGAPGKGRRERRGKGGEGGEGKEGEGVPECPNPELASLYSVAKCLSVRLSVTRRYCVETSKDILKLVSSSGSHTISVFLHQTLWQYCDGPP